MMATGLCCACFFSLEFVLAPSSIACPCIPRVQVHGKGEVPYFTAVYDDRLGSGFVLGSQDMEDMEKIYSDRSMNIMVRGVHSQLCRPE